MPTRALLEVLCTGYSCHPRFRRHRSGSTQRSRCQAKATRLVGVGAGIRTQGLFRSLGSQPLGSGAPAAPDLSLQLQRGRHKPGVSTLAPQLWERLRRNIPEEIQTVRGRREGLNKITFLVSFNPEIHDLKKDDV